MKGVDKIVVDKLKKITIISFMFMLVQILGGYYANSIAIFADAFHLLSDVLAYVISLFAVLMSYKASPKGLMFGYEKLQPLGALVNVGIIWFVTAELFIEATQRIFHQSVVEQPKYMLFTSIFGLLCNLYIMNVLHSDQHAGGHHNCSHAHHKQTSLQSAQKHHEHGHGSCSHSHNDHVAQKEHNHNEQKQHAHKQCSHEHGHHHKHEETKKKEHKCSHDHDHEHEHHESYREIIPQVHSHDGPCQGHHHEQSHSRNEKLRDEISSINSPASDEQIKGHSRHQQKQDRFHNNINIKAAYIHIITDIILSIGVIISAGIIYFFAPEGHVWSYWQIADPVCTYLFSFMAIYTTLPILKESFNFLLDGCDNLQIIDQIQEELRDNQIVSKVENLKIWSTSRGKHYGALRVKVKEGNLRRLKRIFSSRQIEGFVQIVEEEERLHA